MGDSIRGKTDGGKQRCRRPCLGVALLREDGARCVMVVEVSEANSERWSGWTESCLPAAVRRTKEGLSLSSFRDNRVGDCREVATDANQGLFLMARADPSQFTPSSPSGSFESHLVVAGS